VSEKAAHYSWFGRNKENLAAGGGYLIMSCLYAYRVLQNFTTHIAGHGGDGFQNLWNMWWFKHALFTGQNPYFTDMLHYPNGHTLLFHTLNPFNCLLALPLDLILGQPAAYNLVFLFSFAASGFTMYLLAYELFPNRAAAFLAGCVFTFSPFHFAHAQGHLQLVAMEWLPLFLLFLIRSWRNRRIADGIWMGLSLALTAFCSFYYLLAGLIIAGLATFAKLVTERRRVFERKLLFSLGAGAGVFLSTAGVLLTAMLVSYLRLDLVPAHDARFWSADLQSFFIPPWVSAYGPLFIDTWRKWTGNSAECNQYLGYSVIALAIAAFALSRRGERPWGWAGIALCGMFLSLGPVLHWGGHIYNSIPLPYKFLDWIFPILGMSGAPVRWHIITLIAGSILAAGGLNALLARIGDKKILVLSRRHAAALAVTLLVLLEFLPHPIESRTVALPDFIRLIEKSPLDSIVYDIGDPNQALLRQTGHKHKMIGGYASRTTRSALDFISRTPVLRALRGELNLAPEQVKQEAMGLHLRFLIVPSGHRVVGHLRQLGLDKLAEQWGTQLWEIP